MFPGFPVFALCRCVDWKISPQFVQTRTSLEFRSSLAWAPRHVEWHFECRLGEWSTSRRGNLGSAFRRARRDRWFRNRASKGIWREILYKGLWNWMHWACIDDRRQMCKDQKRKRMICCGKVDLLCCKSFYSVYIVNFVKSRPSNFDSVRLAAQSFGRKHDLDVFRLQRHIAPS